MFADRLVYVLLKVVVYIEAFVGVIRVSNVLDNHKPTGIMIEMVTSVMMSAMASPVCPFLLCKNRLNSIVFRTPLLAFAASPDDKARYGSDYHTCYGDNRQNRA